MRDFFDKFHAGWHPDYHQRLDCNAVHEPWSAELEQVLDSKHIVLKTNLRYCYYLIILKPDCWPTLDKNAYIPYHENMKGYTYWELGPLGYGRATLAECIALHKEMTVTTPPVVVAPVVEPPPPVISPEKQAYLDKLAAIRERNAAYRQAKRERSALKRRRRKSPKRRRLKSGK